MDVHCAVEDTPDEGTLRAIEDGLESYDRDQVGPVAYDPLVVTGRAADGSLLGGLTGTVGGGWLYVLHMWVHPDHRGRGLGSSLLRRAEEESLRRDCPRVFLNTLSYQAPVFYERNGYTVFAELEVAPPPHRRIFYRKDLRSSS